MNKRIFLIGFVCALMSIFACCKGDVSYTGQSVLDVNDAIVVMNDTFPISSRIDSCEAIISQADSFLLGEIETTYGTLSASILTQLACPEGYQYPADFHVDSIDSICLFMYYSSWVGDPNAPLSVNAYMMDKGTFEYSHVYPTDLDISDYCSRDHCILNNKRIVLASEKRDSILNASGVYVPMVKMRVNDDFMQAFGSIKSFESQEKFNQLFNGLLIETSFGSSTVLNVTDIALGVYYRFGYKKNGRDTVVHDMKAFYANSEVRTVNHLEYRDKKEWVEALQDDSATYNYIVSPAGVYTRISLPIRRIADTITLNLVTDSVYVAEAGGYAYLAKRPYVNKAEVRVSIQNKGTDSGPDAWLQPADYMLLIKEESMDRFFLFKELPSDTCAILGQFITGYDAKGKEIYYYSYDLSALLTNQLRNPSDQEMLNMLLVPVSVKRSTSTSTTSASIIGVRQQQTLSATKILSAKNGMKFEIVYSGF